MTLTAAGSMLTQQAGDKINRSDQGHLDDLLWSIGIYIALNSGRKGRLRESVKRSSPPNIW
jgi:hypothetical protein